MTQEIPPGGRTDGPRGDPWLAFGYVVSGVVIYGFMGWLLDRWFGTSFLVAVGILLGAGLALYQTFARFGLRSPTDGDAPTQEQHPQDRTQ